ncbi:MAG: universal stress protein [Clostridia bacterium]
MGYKRILVPIDGSSTARLGLREALRLAKGGQGAQRATIQLVHVVDEHYILMAASEVGVQLGSVINDLKAGGRRMLKAAEATVRQAGLPCTTVMLETLTGPAAEPIVRQARKWRADLIVIGTHGRRGVRRLLLGSDAEQIVRTSPVPVLLVRSKR